MIRRALNGLLILLLLLGAYRAWQSSQQRARLRHTRDHLTQIVGALPVSNPAQVHILALKSDDPQHFLWRTYLPPNYAYDLEYEPRRGVDSSGRWGSSDSISHLQFQVMEQGFLRFSLQFGSSGIGSRLGDEALARFLQAHWDDLQVEQLGSPDLTSLDPDDSALFFRLSMPPDLAAEARKTLPAADHKYIPVLFELNLIPKPKKP